MFERFLQKMKPRRWAGDRGVDSNVTLDGLSGVARKTAIPQSIASARFLDYTSTAGEYTRRALSRPEDSVYAILGILETLYQIGPFYDGIPE
jgi:hypothetical protein